MRRAFKYRIKPNKMQTIVLHQIFGFNRWLYNSALEERIDRYKRTGKGITYNQQAAELPEIKKSFVEAKTVFAQTMQQTLKQAESAGREFHQDDPAYTSCTCFACGHIETMSETDRIFKCSRCGYEADRDVNAARNIRKRGSENRAKRITEAGVAFAITDKKVVSEVLLLG